MKKVISLFIVALTVLLLVGCNIDPKTTHIISFNSNGGTVVSAVLGYEGMELEEPEEPTKDGYTFSGWYKEKELTNKVTWPFIVTKAEHFYAKWEPLNQ